MKILQSITPMIVFYFSPFCLSLLAEETKPCDVFVELAERINQSDKSVTQINAIAQDVKIAIQNMDLTGASLTDHELWKLRYESQRAVKGLLWRSDLKESKPDDLTDPVIECIALYLEKIHALIDPEWEWVNVSVHNVTPPEGVPLRMPGMNPDAIEDPALRDEYLERIADAARINDRNGSQRARRDDRASVLFILRALANDENYPNWTKESVETRFGTSPELLAAIREYWKED